jgi:hypothetical protein
MDDLVADAISSITATLQNGSSLTGAVNASNAAVSINLTLSTTSTWSTTGDSFLTSLTDPSGISGTTISNVIGNGHTIYYDTRVCPALRGLTYIFSGGGSLKPAN